VCASSVLAPAPCLRLRALVCASSVLAPAPYLRLRALVCASSMLVPPWYQQRPHISQLHVRAAVMPAPPSHQQRRPAWLRQRRPNTEAVPERCLQCSDFTPIFIGMHRNAPLSPMKRLPGCTIPVVPMHLPPMAPMNVVEQIRALVVPQPALFVTKIYMYCISFSKLHMCLEEERIFR
jgi:hypothetical protein